ncbi:MAG: VanW family protein [Actinoplanes sp.]
MTAVDQDPTAVLPPSEPEPEPAKPFNTRRAVVVGSVAAVLLAGGGFTAYAMAGDVPRGTRVLGVELGALSRTEAEQKLHDRFDPMAADPVRVLLAGQAVSLRPTDLNARVDVDATVGRAMRGGFHLIGQRTVDPVVELDQPRLEAALRKQLDRKRITMRKPAITFAGLTPKPVYPQAGLDLDPAVAAAAVRAAWPRGEVAEVALVQRTPATTKAEVDQLISGLVTPALAAPVTVTVGGKPVVLTPAAIAKGLVFRADDAGRLTPAIDGAKLHAAASAAFAKVEIEPVSARIALAGGKPRTVASTPGTVVDLAKLGPALLAVLPQPAPRSVAGELTRTKAPTTDADLAKLGVKERVSTFTTYFTGGKSSPRSQNIITVAKAVDGALVKPGATFSLNGHTGERDYKAGYQDAPVIVGGKLEPGVAGGASQFTTTLFNAAYYAGLQDVEHKPHSFYFSRYPSVIESTIFYPTLDLKFKNTTPYGILIDTATTGRSVTVSMWSTKVYDSVKTVYGPRRGHTSPPTVHREAGPKCITSSGLPGFTQDAWRVIRKDGREVAREKFSWRYDPEPRFVCGGEPQE